ncbi:MAG: hypothetical protein KAH31_00640 [Candidatus Sabulitectum sp.]|nr:hypothetical protein [Candidatus Sabulitectum sp.]
MIFLMFFLLSDIPSPVQVMWDLRAGRSTEVIPAIAGAPVYFRANMLLTDDLTEYDLTSMISQGNKSMLVPLTAHMVSEGRTAVAEIYCELDGLQLPATRLDLLDALAWFCRHELYSVMALQPVIPSDMQGSMHSEYCGAVCAMGWMSTREDGLFHGEQLVSQSDIRILSTFFSSVVPTLKFIPRGLLDHMFLNMDGAGR